jgi:hypothetical protein
MIKSVYHSGYHDEYDRTHVVIHNENRYFSFSYGIYSQLKKLGKVKDHKEYVLDHPFIGKTFINKYGKIHTVKSIFHSQVFGHEYILCFEDEKGSGGTFSLYYEGNFIYKQKPLEAIDYEYIVYENQLRHQCNLPIGEEIYDF